MFTSKVREGEAGADERGGEKKVEKDVQPKVGVRSLDSRRKKEKGFLKLGKLC